MQLSGCKTLEIPMRTFNINNLHYFVYSLTAKVEVTEEGTGTVLKQQADISITRTVLTMKDENPATTYTKPELPYSSTVTRTPCQHYPTQHGNSRTLPALLLSTVTRALSRNSPTRTRLPALPYLTR